MVSEYGNCVQPLSDTPAIYRPGMPSTAKHTLSVNVCRLMEYRYGRVNAYRLSNDAKIGLGTANRIVDGNTSVGADIIDKVADFFGLPAWALMVPGLDPENPPRSWLTQSELDRFERAKALARDLAEQ